MRPTSRPETSARVMPGRALTPSSIRTTSRPWTRWRAVATGSRPEARIAGATGLRTRLAGVFTEVGALMSRGPEKLEDLRCTCLPPRVVSRSKEGYGTLLPRGESYKGYELKKFIGKIDDDIRFGPGRTTFFCPPDSPR